MSGPYVWEMPPSVPDEPSAADSDQVVEGGAIDHVANALTRLCEYAKGKPKIRDLLTMLVEPVQDVENAFQQILLERTVDRAIGAQLDVVGEIVGQPRSGVTDDELYRRYIRARIATNKSRGTVNDLLKVARLVVYNEEASLVVDLQGTAALVLGVYGPGTSDEVADILIAFLRQAVAAGVRIILETDSAPDEDSFYTGLTVHLDGAHIATATTININEDLSDYPETGVLIIDEGTADEEYIRYYFKDNGGKFYVAAPGLVNAHDDTAAVTWADGPGQGFALTAFLDGALVGAETDVIVDSPIGLEFPATGFIALDAGTDDEEILEYASRTHDTFALVGAVAGAHDDRAAVTLYTGGMIVVAEDSDVTTTDDDNGTVTSTILAGRYNRERFLFEFQDQLPDGWTVQRDLNAKIVIDYPPAATTFDLAWATLSFKTLVGFAADITGASAPQTATNALDETGGTCGGVLADARGSGGSAEVNAAAGVML